MQLNEGKLFQKERTARAEVLRTKYAQDVRAPRQGQGGWREENKGRVGGRIQTGSEGLDHRQDTGSLALSFCSPTHASISVGHGKDFGFYSESDGRHGEF